jgi:hypothetical protein
MPDSARQEGSATTYGLINNTAQHSKIGLSTAKAKVGTAWFSDDCSAQICISKRRNIIDLIKKKMTVDTHSSAKGGPAGPSATGSGCHASTQILQRIKNKLSLCGY